MAVDDAIRRRLASFARSRHTRTRVFRPDRPCDWQATAITDPRSREVFTEDGAWQYVAEAIEAGVEIEVIELQQPPGKKGYVMNLASTDPKRPIYVKLQLGGSNVIGRSFHYTTRPHENT